MKPRLPALALFIALSHTLLGEEAGIQLCESWNAAYTGEDATGDQVIALWQFKPGAEMEDASRGGHDLTLHGAKISPDGRFGSCLESFRGWPVDDQRHQATAKNHPDLSPPGAFTIEMWIKPKPELNADYPEAFLVDKKYVADDDYQLILGRPDRYGSRTLRACLGFGRGSRPGIAAAGPLRGESPTPVHQDVIRQGLTLVVSNGSQRVFPEVC